MYGHPEALLRDDLAGVENVVAVAVEAFGVEAAGEDVQGVPAVGERRTINRAAGKG